MFRLFRIALAKLAGVVSPFFPFPDVFFLLLVFLLASVEFRAALLPITF